MSTEAPPTFTPVDVCRAVERRLLAAMEEHPDAPYVSAYITRRQAEVLTRLVDHRIRGGGRG